jgi:hypothetical protein
MDKKLSIGDVVWFAREKAQITAIVGNSGVAIRVLKTGQEIDYVPWNTVHPLDSGP